MKKSIFAFITILILVILMEGISLFGLIYLKNNKKIDYTPVNRTSLTEQQLASIDLLLNQQEKYITHDPVLGWTLKPNGHSELYQANAQGLRSNTVYPPTPPKDKIRIATFGDSFVHCDEVNNSETWQHYLNGIDSRIETINFGVSGYGSDQAFLRYQKLGKTYKPRIVIIGFMSENPKRSVNTFRPFYSPKTNLPFSKPRFTLESDKLKLIDNPLPTRADYEQLKSNTAATLHKLGKMDGYAQSEYVASPWDKFLTVRLTKLLWHEYKISGKQKVIKNGTYNTELDQYRVTMAIMEEFYQMVKADGAEPIVVIIPNIGDILRYKHYKNKVYASFTDRMDQLGMNYLDLTEEFYYDKSLKYLKPLFAENQHLSASGNQKAAGYIHRYLIKQKLIPAPTQ